MNLNNLFTEIEKVDPEVYDRLDSRRSAMRQFAKTGGKIALSAVPFLFGGMFKKAYGGSTDSIVEVLNYALTLEYLESEFYIKGVATSGLIPAGAPAAAITTIRDHEVAHVAFLQGAITASGGTPVAKPTFDFSGGTGSGNGPFKDAFSNYPLFLAVAQTFEDTGVRAYKGRAVELMSNNDVLEAALKIHSVEARHASHIRSMRRNLLSNTAIKPWITGNDTGGIGANVQASYNGEENTTQAGVQITGINGMAISANAASESFDEALTKDQVLAIVKIFIKP